MIKVCVTGASGFVGRRLIDAIDSKKTSMKWSDTSGHRVKTLKCHNEVRDDNRKANEKEIYRRLQA